MTGNEINELIKRLRNCSDGNRCNACDLMPDNNCSDKLMQQAANALEEYRRRDQFQKFIWDTLGLMTMRLLIDMYNDEESGDV